MTIEKTSLIKAAQEYQKALQELFATEHVVFVHTFIHAKDIWARINESEAQVLKSKLLEADISVDEYSIAGTPAVTAAIADNVAITINYAKEGELN